MFSYLKSGVSRGIEFLKSKSGVAVVLGGAVVIGGLYYYFRKKQDKPQGDLLPSKSPPRTKEDDPDDNASKGINQEQLTEVQKESDPTRREDHVELVIEKSICPPEPRLYNLESETKEKQEFKDQLVSIPVSRHGNIEDVQYIGKDKSYVSIQVQTNELGSVVLDSSQLPEKLDEESVIKYEIIKNIDGIIKEQWAFIEQLGLMGNIVADNLKTKNINLEEVIKLIICQKIYNYSWKTLNLEWDNYVNHKAISIRPSELQRNYWNIWKKDGRLEELHKIFEEHSTYRAIEKLYKKQFKLVLQQQEEAFDEGFNIRNMKRCQNSDIEISIPKAWSITSTELGGKKYFGYNFLKGGASSFDSQAYEHAYFRYVKEHAISSSGSSSGGVYSDWGEPYKTLTLEDKIMKKDQLKLQYKWLDAFARLIIYMVERQEGGGDTKCVAIAHAGPGTGLVIGLNTGSAVNLVSQTVNELIQYSSIEEIQKYLQPNTALVQMSEGRGKESGSSSSKSLSTSSKWYNEKTLGEDITEFIKGKIGIAKLPITYTMNGMQVYQTPANLEVVVKMHAEMSIIQYLLSMGYQFGEGLYIGNNKYACPGCHASMTLLNRDEAIKIAYRGHHNDFRGVSVTVEDLVKGLTLYRMQDLSKQISSITSQLDAMANLFQQSSIMDGILQFQALSVENLQQTSIQTKNLASHIEQIMQITSSQFHQSQQMIRELTIQLIVQARDLNQKISDLKYIEEGLQDLFQGFTEKKKGGYENKTDFKSDLSTKIREISKKFTTDIKTQEILTWWHNTVIAQIHEFRQGIATVEGIGNQLQDLYQEIMQHIQAQSLRQQIIGEAQTLHQSIIAEVRGLHQQVTGQIGILYQEIGGEAQSLLEHITYQVQDILRQSSFNHKQVTALLEAQRFFQQVSEGKEFEPYIAIHDSYQVIPHLWGKEQQLLKMINTQVIQGEIQTSKLQKSQNPEPSGSPANGFSDEKEFHTALQEFSLMDLKKVSVGTDLNSWYNDNHIHRLLNHYLPYQDGYTVITPFVFDEHNIDVYTAQAVQAAAGGQIVVIPINLGGNHWVGAVMWVEQGTQALRVIYNDPLGGTIQNSEHAIYFIEQLTTHTSTLDLQLNTFDARIPQQQNYNDCGAFTTQNLIALAQAVQPNRGLNNEEAMQILEQQASRETEIREQHNADLQQLGLNIIPYPGQSQEYQGTTKAIDDISGIDARSFNINLYGLNTQEGNLCAEILELEDLIDKMQFDKKYIIIDSERENPDSQLKLNHILQQPNVEVKFTGIQYNCYSNTASCADNVLLSQIVMTQEGYKTYVLQTRHHEYNHLSLIIEYAVAEEDDLMQKVAQIENGEYQITDKGGEVWESYKSGFANSTHHVDKLIEKGNAVPQYAIKQKQPIAIATENKNDRPEIEETNSNVQHSECTSYRLVSNNFSFLTPYVLNDKLEAQVEFFEGTGIAFETLGNALDTGQISIIEIPSLLDSIQDNIEDEGTISLSDLLMSRFILNELDFSRYFINEKLRVQTEFFGRTGIIFETLQNAFNGDIMLNDNIIQGTMINIGALYSNFIHNLGSLTNATFQVLQEVFDKGYQFNRDINQNISMDTDWCNNPTFNIGSFEFEIPELNFFLCNGMIYWEGIS